jgi:hypothetical protein
MELLIGFVIAAIIGTVMLVKLIFWVTDKSAGVAITSYFQAAEYILEHHQPPTTWTSPSLPISQQIFGKNKKKPLQPDQLLERMDDLIAFFEHSTFFQDEDARTALLEQLHDERESWVQNPN